MRIVKNKASQESLAESILLPVSLFVTLVTFFIVLVFAVRPALSLGTNLALLSSPVRVTSYADPVDGSWLSEDDEAVASAYAGSTIIAPVPVERVTQESPSGRRIIYANFGGIWLTTPITDGERLMAIPSVRILRIERFYPSILTDDGSIAHEE